MALLHSVEGALARRSGWRGGAAGLAMTSASFVTERRTEAVQWVERLRAVQPNLETGRSLLVTDLPAAAGGTARSSSRRGS